MGMEDGRISQYQIKTSSDKNQKSLGRYGRLNLLQTEDHNGGWVSAQLDQKQYIQINFYAPRVLTGIITQGRHASPQWVTHYSVWFSQDGKNWIPVISKLDEANKGLQYKIFPANRDSDTPVKNVFPISVKAQYIRIVPLAWHNWIALRLEVLGCYEEPPTATPIVYNMTSPLPTRPPGVPQDCYQPMGLSNRSLPDILIKVSSSKSEVSKIRLDSHADAGSPGAWVAAPNDHRRTIIIDMTGLRNLTGIVTQGREDADMWVTAYTVEYSADGTKWEDAIDKEKNSVIFEGNRDRSSRALRLFKNMIEARYLKITIVKFHERPAIRFELYGCFEGYNICTETGPWLVASQHREGEIMPMPEILKKSGLCNNPFEIECQIAAKHKDYTQGNQKMACDLEKGLRCLHEDQINKLCYLYQVRIKCLCPETTVPPPITKPIPLTVCPEVPEDVKPGCPPYCQAGYLCDGEKCVSSESCPCYIGHKPFNTSFSPHTSDCKVCTCTLGGHSSCVPKECPPCPEHQKLAMNDATCECECIPCPDGHVLCPTDGICIKKEEWCDEIAQCQDDEIYCPKETSPVPSTSLPPPRPKCEPPLCECNQSVCKMYGSNFKTFDGAEYVYDKICDHILMKDYANESYYVTVHRTCTMGNLCRRSLTIKAGDIIVTFGPGDKEVTVQSQPVAVSNFGAVSKRFKAIRLEKNGHKIIFISKDYNFKVIWDALQDAEIDITCGPYFVYGLCGFRKGNEILTEEDDLTMPDGTLASTIKEFGDSYRIGSRVCHDVPQCPEHLRTISLSVCKKLSQEPFNKCVRDMSIESKHHVCMQHMCDCLQENQEDVVLSEQKCKCRAYESFVDDCTSNSMEILQLKSTWRAGHGCSVECPPQQYYQECGYEVTCDNYKEERSSCSSGCFCPPGLVLHHNRCVEPKMCQDCICMGYGDPNYYSFRETYIPFQGLCTYVLAQHNAANQEHLNFMVLGTNVECPEEPKTSCLESIEVVWNGHSVLKTKDLSVVFDGQVLTNLPYVAHGISVASFGKDETIIHIADIQLTVRYHDKNYGFRIETSSYYYFNNTLGLCGECDFTESEYLTTSSGVLTTNATEFGYSWLVETQDLSKCILIPPTPTIVEPSLCNFTSNACDVVKDTSIYVTPCKHDIGYSKNVVKSVCRAKMQFAKDCCEMGVSLKDWLMESGCIEDMCSEDMVYSCASACVKTCDNYKTFDPDNCDVRPVLACSCPPGTVWHLGRCSEERICQTCDSDGHVIGDRWKKDPCTSCECLPDLNVHCSVVTCTLPPSCLSNETLVEFKPNNESCCSSYSCEPSPVVPCPEVEEPVCAPGETLTVKYEDNCPFPVCECRIEMCPDVFMPLSLHPSEQYELVTKVCCKEYHLVCNFSLCEEPPECKLGFELSSADGKCCSTYECVKKENVCVYQHKYQVVDGFAEKLPPEKVYQVEYTVGSSWKDGLCISCDCEGTTTNCNYTSCYNIRESPEAEKYYYEEEFLPYQCCPIHIAKFCVANGIQYKINDTWVSTEDKCKSYRCADAGNGKLNWEEKYSECITECPANAIYIPPPEHSLLCCGLCKNLTCEANGIIHQIDERWESIDDPCYISECVREELEAKIIAHKKECPEIKENCPQEFIVTKECCRYCNLPSGYCSAVEMTFSEILDFFRLSGKNGISCFLNETVENMKKCEGRCQEISFSSYTNIFENVCGCCLPNRQIERQVKLDCTDGSKLLTTYQEPISCQCISCSGGRQLKVPESV